MTSPITPPWRSEPTGPPDSRGPSATLTIIILTYNEALHIERCLAYAERVADEIVVVDSYSTDGTPELAARLGARVSQHAWTNYASQFNWALANIEVRTKWVMRLDADEMLDEALTDSLKRQLAGASTEVGGFELNRRIRFMGQEIRHGSMAPMWVTRIWRNGHAHCESRWMDEHMVVDVGRVDRIHGSVVDDNLNSLTWWTDKHNRYASREALDLLMHEHQEAPRAGRAASHLNRQAQVKRWLKTEVYARLPIATRAWMYYFYRMVLRGGILDGSQGMAFHTLQGLWYRLLVDYKVAEVRRHVDEQGGSWTEAVRHVLGVDPETFQPDSIDGFGNV